MSLIYGNTFSLHACFLVSKILKQSESESESEKKNCVIVFIFMFKNC